MANVRLAQKVLARNPIQNVIEAIPVCEQHQFAGLALPVGIYQDGRLGCVQIEKIVRRELEMPLELAGIGVEGNEGVGVQVVAQP